MAKILIADDNLLSLEYLAEAVSRFGHEADRARDGVEACSLASAQPYDLMIIDSRMPRRGGLESLHIIRSEGGHSSMTKAVATTADAGLNPDELLRAGFAAVVVKPIPLEEFRALLAQHLPTRPIQDGDLDDTLALSRSGGDTTIMNALRSLLGGELDALPREIEEYAQDRDEEALRDRLHRLDASAGFCGATRLTGAIAELRRALDTENTWPDKAIRLFLDVSAQTRSLLGQGPELS
ncbi:response regulator [Dokdonella sp.]|uniref:response regulator n=1 Tax=Dokdonella sp. TaxID=2291710 RepID=UPI003C3EA17D